MVTDCNALVYAVNKANLNPRIARWTLHRITKLQILINAPTGKSYDACRRVESEHFIH